MVVDGTVVVVMCVCVCIFCPKCQNGKIYHYIFIGCEWMSNRLRNWAYKMVGIQREYSTRCFRVLTRVHEFAILALDFAYELRFGHSLYRWNPKNE